MLRLSLVSTGGCDNGRRSWERLVAVVAITAAFALGAAGFWTSRASAQVLAGSSTPVQVSQCGPGSSGAEPLEAVDQQYVYDLWMNTGCRIPNGSAIAFARSTDGGRQFRPSLAVPGSFSPANPNSSSWDPALAVARNGTLYAAFMFFNADTEATYPVVAASFDHGQTFPQVSALPVPPFTDPLGNWGDRDYIAVAPNGTVYVTWDYGPSFSEIQFLCSPTGSCAFAAGDNNAVIQKSTDGGKTWTAVHPVSPGFPLGGVFAAPIVVQPDGTIDALYLGHHTDPTTLAFSPGGEYFTRSSDGGQTWSAPVQVGPSAGTIALTEWWIDCNIATDQAGNLYATWDTQTATTDIGWLSYSTNDARTWSHPIRVTPDQGDSEELLAAVGARPGVAYVAWQTPAAPQGYATFIRPFSIDRGWLTPAPIQVSTAYGDPNVWPGDTIGIATLHGRGTTRIGPPAVLSWGSAINGNPDQQIYSSIVSFSGTAPNQRTAAPATPGTPLRAPATTPPSRSPFRTGGRTH